MLVIDTSALVEVLTTDPAATPDLAQRVHGVEWMSAPSLIDYEVLNVLRKLALRQSIDIELAEDSRRTLRALRLVRYPMSDGLADRVWQLRHNASAYDASFVALAEHLNVPLVTAERRLAERVRGLTTVPVESYARFGASSPRTSVRIAPGLIELGRGTAAIAPAAPLSLVERA